MVIALKKLCLCFYLFHNVQAVVNAKMSRLPYSKNKIQQSQPIEPYANDKNLIDTPGCTIPNIWTEYQNVEKKNCKNRCGIRAVIIERSNDDNIIEFVIIRKYMKEFFGEDPYECCFRFAYKSTTCEKLEFTDCLQFVNGTQILLEHEIITVNCKRKEKPYDHYIYEDAYILVRKLTKESSRNDGKSWNVLLLGMGTMSRRRAIQSMPELVKYFEENGWLDYRAFQKAESNTYPNLMITYTGLYRSNFFPEDCNNSRKKCNDLFIWSKFKLSNFVTAYGEDGLPHTFESVITNQPTDHYTRSFFLLGTESQGNLVCLKTRPCAYHILDYVYQFAKAYQDMKYFGSFWTSNYRHNPVHIPTLLQNQYIDLFKKLDDLGALNNTIIFFYGDHGVRYGQLKIPVASYYDERLPMLYMWFPLSFRERFEDKYYSLQLNQYRLTTHSDLHSTLWNILELSNDEVEIIPPRYCSNCGSLLEEKPKDRRCEDMGVTARWCSCNVLYSVNSTDIAATLVPDIFLYRVNKDYDANFHIKQILRHHWFRHEHDDKNNITYYVIAIEVTYADKRFEGVIKQHGLIFNILGDVDNISPRDQFIDTSQC